MSVPWFPGVWKRKGKRYAASLVKMPDRKCTTFVIGPQVRSVLTMFLSGGVKGVFSNRSRVSHSHIPKKCKAER